MKLYGVLTILFMVLSAVYGLRCYTCITTNPKHCTQIMTCTPAYNRCFTFKTDGITTKGCQTSDTCIAATACCNYDLCNSAIPASPSVILLLLSSAIFTFFF